MSRDSSMRIEEIAGDWLARRETRQWTAEEQRAFDAWLNESTAHRVAFLRLELTWEKAARLKVLGAGRRSETVPMPGEWTLSPFFERADAAAAVRSIPREVLARARQSCGSAAFSRAVAAGVILAAGLWAFNTDFLTQHRYSTPVGGIATVPMTDGSKVTLNTDSKIRLAVTHAERRVELERGEAFFSVAKDSKRPFVVIAGKERVVAIGTQFSVRREGDTVRVVVTEGRVRVERPGQDVRAEIAAMTPGMIVRMGAGGTLVQHRPLVEAEETLSWRSGVLVFHQVTLQEAVAEFNRYTTRKMSIEDSGVAAMTIAGSFRATNVQGFVRLLEQGYPLRSEERGGKLVLRGRGN